jgi:hypothetical protein
MEYKFSRITTVEIGDILAYNRDIENKIREKLTKNDVLALTENEPVEIEINGYTFILTKFGMSSMLEDLNAYVEIDIRVEPKEFE